MNDKSKNKIRRAFAIVGLVFMAIFTVSFIAVLVNPHFADGAFGYLSLISVLLGAGSFMLVKFVLADKEQPEYLPNGDESEPARPESEDRAESEASESEENPSDNENAGDEKASA